MIQNEYLIQELADKTSISPRTIRYYQQEGLLPEPENRGKFAYYNNDHLDRLKLIQELKKNYLPLKEIREQLNSLTSEQVKSLLESHKADKLRQVSFGDKSKDKPVQPGSDTALQYISRVLQTQTEIRDQEFEKFQSTPYKKPDTSRYVAGTPTESWQRIILAPGIEIQVKEPLSPQDRKRLEELIKIAKSLFF